MFYIQLNTSNHPIAPTSKMKPRNKCLKVPHTGTIHYCLYIVVFEAVLSQYGPNLQ